MNTTTCILDADRPDHALLIPLGEAIRAGELVAFPTETVYGLGADATNPAAVSRIFVAKDRPANDPLIVHIANPGMLAITSGVIWSELGPTSRLLIDHFWPGPLTLILPRGERIPGIVAAQLPTVGVRMPAHPVALALIEAANVPIAAPSANRFGHTSPTTAQHVSADLDGRIPWIIDGGPCPIGLESTILDVTQDVPVLLRPGGIAVETIEECLHSHIIQRDHFSMPDETAAPSPGMLLRHYAPAAQMIVFEGDDEERVWAVAAAEVQAQSLTKRRVGALVPEEYLAVVKAHGAYATASLGHAGDTTAYARALFTSLRALEAAGCDVIISGIVGRQGIGLALRDRLWRAASGVIIPVVCI